MGQVKILTDSTSDLSPELLKANDIAVIPLYVSFADQVYKDGVEITPEKVYVKVKELGKLPKTAAPSPGDFRNFFQPFITEGYDLIYIGLSSHFSSTFQNAVIASQDFPENRIEIFDSLNLSTGVGLQVMKAVDYAKQGLGIKAIAERLKSHVKKVETEFIIDTLNYLYLGGRCSGMQNFIGTLSKFRPIVKVVNGKMVLANKIRGKRQRALAALLDSTLRNKEHIDLSRIFVTHSSGIEDARYLKEQLENLTAAKEVIITNAGCVISSHCGPNTVGILYITK